MKNTNRILIAIAFISILASCQSPEKKAQERLMNMEKTIAKDTSKMPDKKKLNDLFISYKNFADSFPKNDSISEYLFRAGRLASSLTYLMEAVNCYDKAYANYPTSKRAPFCLFMEGFIYENQLHGNEKAKKLYEEFMKKYPDHELAKDVKFSLDHIGKSDEELIKEFEAKQKSKNS